MSALRLSRRGLFGGAIALLAAPAIVRVASIMPVVRTPDEAELLRLLEKRMADFYNRLIWSDDSPLERNGLAALIRDMDRPKPDAIFVGEQTWHTYRRYSGYASLALT